jgi:hypothetical protein
MIAIKGREMPKSCSECPLLQGVSGEQCCSVTGEPSFRIRECPLVEIVNCKDCKHRDPEDKFCDCGHMIKWSSPREDDWYCADGERRE